MKNEKKYTVAVAGASGYAGGEILRLIINHPNLQLKTITAHSNVGQKLSIIHPHLWRYSDLEFIDTTVENLKNHDIVFFALPHGASAEIAASLPENIILVDCGADHRLESEQDWAAYYGGKYYDSWVYGVPELLNKNNKQRDLLKKATKIAAPGCNASTVALAFAPGIFRGVISGIDLQASLSVGPSGAGKSLKTSLLASEIMGSASAYSVAGTHRHIPEILQALRNNSSDAQKNNYSICFTPVLVPMSRGILAVCSAKVDNNYLQSFDTNDTGFLDKINKSLHQIWQEYYADDSFIRIMPLSSYPRTSDVLGSNVCAVGLGYDKNTGRVVIVAAIDNLVKGTAGAALQSLNLALGLSENISLSYEGVAP